MKGKKLENMLKQTNKSRAVQSQMWIAGLLDKLDKRYFTAALIA